MGRKIWGKMGIGRLAGEEWTEERDREEEIGKQGGG